MSLSLCLCLYVSVSMSLSSIFCLSMVHIILLLLTVTAIGLCSSALGLLFFGIIFVLDISQSLWTSSVRALLKHSSKYFLTTLSLIRTFISSAGILSIPVAFLFFILFIVSTNSFSLITGSFIIPELSFFICWIIFVFSPSFSLYQNVKSAFCSFWYTCSVQSFRNSGIMK